MKSSMRFIELAAVRQQLMMLYTSPLHYRNHFMLGHCLNLTYRTPTSVSITFQNFSPPPLRFVAYPYATPLPPPQSQQLSYVIIPTESFLVTIWVSSQCSLPLKALLRD
mmetsp:Transcript_9654/g.13287  ORF Transcript_9654/g.13287 Transcript_9654/m.13287 type:complete len:109 (+) Transcript_9654:202-528(+)